MQVKRPIRELVRGPPLRALMKCVWIPLIAFCCNGCAFIQTASETIIVFSQADDADYTLLGASISNNPGLIAPGAVKEFEITFTYRLNATGGVVSPWVFLLDHDIVARQGHDLLVAKQFSEGATGTPPDDYVGRITLRLTCANDEVVGAEEPHGRSGEGHWALINGIDEAEIFARVQRGRENPTQTVVSLGPIDVWCEE